LSLDATVSSIMDVGIALPQMAAGLDRGRVVEAL